eukprot:1362964-Amorphochlora_amoeboformis.AAC.1
MATFKRSLLAGSRLSRVLFLLLIAGTHARWSKAPKLRVHLRRIRFGISLCVCVREREREEIFGDSSCSGLSAREEEILRREERGETIGMIFWGVSGELDSRARGLCGEGRRKGQEWDTKKREKKNQDKNRTKNSHAELCLTYPSADY